MNNIIKLTEAEIQSGHTRQLWAEGLIEQLPANHDGRNSWLLNYGVRGEAQRLRSQRGVLFDPEFMAAETAPPRPLQVGDRVKYRFTDSVGKILDVVGDFAWCEWPNGPSTWKLSDLERAP